MTEQNRRIGARPVNHFDTGVGTGKQSGGMHHGALIPMLSAGDHAKHQALVAAQVTGTWLVKSQRTGGAYTKTLDQRGHHIKRVLSVYGTQRLGMGGHGRIPVAQIPVSQTGHAIAISVDDEVFRLLAKIRRCRTVPASISM